jgi:hypothetical protein
MVRAGSATYLMAQKIVDGEPAHVATLDERLAAAAD